ncbi:hypothetical protein MUK42_35771 [Musa troglodytarum]|uniref:VQ domain-containing protein n=1 Tax=Musa troglodytarum TaxID=320322 RepID=A0A9E7JBS8_9LILI|nr:hypothetical protein MUK42_35771 [Musa troglodytarum]
MDRHCRLMSSRSRQAAGDVKVVVVETRYVRTDAEHFKYVVQTLTGKDSILEAVVPEMPIVVPGRPAEDPPDRVALPQPDMVVQELERLYAVDPPSPKLHEEPSSRECYHPSGCFR